MQLAHRALDVSIDMHHLHSLYSMLQVLLSLEVYIFAPQLQRRLAGALPFSRALLPAAFAVAALLLVGRQSVLLTSALLCMLAFVALLCPMWLVRIHKFKAQINGPWDEAAPRLSSKLAAPS